MALSWYSSSPSAGSGNAIWDPRSILGLEETSRCVGFAVTRGRRCLRSTGVSFMKNILRDMSTMDPNPSTLEPHLNELAAEGLCWQHQHQAPDVVAKWKRRIRSQYSMQATLAEIPRRRALNDLGERWLQARLEADESLLNPSARSRRSTPSSRTSASSVSSTASTARMTPPSRQTTGSISSLDIGPPHSSSAGTIRSASTPSRQRTRSPNPSTPESTRTSASRPTTPVRRPSEPRIRTTPEPTTSVSNTPESRTPVAASASSTAPPTPRPTLPAQYRRRCPRTHTLRRDYTDEDCPVCTEPMANSGIRALVWCKVSCGRSVHRECFSQWQESQNSSGRAVTCIYCRRPWEESCEHDLTLPSRH